MSKTLLTLALLYTFSYLLWRLLLDVFAFGWWGLQLSVIFSAWVYLLLLPLLLLALLLGNKRAVMALFVPLFFFATEYGHQFLPQWSLSINKAENHKQVRVITWNSNYKNSNVVAFRQAVDSLQPDLIAIQEISPQIANYTNQELKKYFPYQEMYPENDAAGMAILSRYPFVSIAPLEIGYGCNCQQITIDFGGHLVTIINMHIWPPNIYVNYLGPIPWPTYFSAENQDRIMDNLLGKIKEASHPLLVLGDMNTTDREPNYQRIKLRLTDTFAEVGWGMGFTFTGSTSPSNLLTIPFIRIDYIFHDEFWRALHTLTGRISGSDHLYVLADLLLY